MTSKLTRERIEQYANDPRMCNINDEIREMARMALTAMDSEPVAEVLSNRPGNDTSTIDRALPVGTQLYRHAQLAPERDQVRNEHAEWSQATFGNVVPVGPLKHLSKEALEAVAEPDDLSEWADMQSLLWDAQRRAGITDEQITQAMIEKLVVNKQREWPEPKDEEPRLHIKEQPAPVVPPMQHWEELCRQYPDMSIRDAIIRAAWWNHCRAAMLQAGNSPVIPDGYVMVPKEPTEAMMLHNSGCQHHAWDDPDCAMRQTRRLIWSHMLAAAPQEVKGEHQIRDEMDMGARITSHRFKV